MRTQVIVLAVFAALLQVEAHPALFSKPSGGFFGGLLGNKQSDVDLAKVEAEVINDVAEEVNETKQSSGGLFQSIKDKGEEMKNTVTGGVKGAVEKVQEVQSEVQEQVTGAIGGAVEKAQEVQSGIQGQVTGAIGGAVEKAQEVQLGVQEQLAAAVEKAQEVQSGIQGQVTGAIEGAVEKAQEVQAGVQGKLGAIVERVQEVKAGVQEKVTGAIGGAVETAQGVAGKFAEAIDGVVDTVAPVTLWGRIVGFFTGWMRPSAKDINKAVSEGIETAAASLTSVGSGLPIVESAGIAKPTIAVA